MRAALHVATTRTASSAALLGLLGTLQWFDLLNRGKFSFYSAVYRETRDHGDWTTRTLPVDCIRELLASITLSPFWGVDMRLSHLDFVAATDASSEFGIGGCIAKASPTILSNLLMAAERDGVYVTLEDIVDKPRTRSLGTPHQVPFKAYDFGTIFSYRLTDNEHINLREAHAILFYLQ